MNAAAKTRLILKRLFNACLIFSLFAHAQAAPVFKITKGDNTVYLAGTMHLLKTSDYPLPEAFDRAYQQSDKLYFEIDITSMETHEFMQKYTQMMMYQNGSNLRSQLNSQTFERLSRCFKSQGLAIDKLISMTPLGVIMALTSAEYQKRGFIVPGVDSHYFLRAKEDNKAIAWFETPEQQLVFLDSFDDSEPNELINHTLDQMVDVEQYIDSIHLSWRTGDMRELESKGLAAFKDYPNIYKIIISNRNDQWSEKIIAMFDDEETEFVLAGALHLPGPDGLITQLQKLGYSVQSL